MTREEAQQACAELAASSPDRATHRFFPHRDVASGQWQVAKLTLPQLVKPTGTLIAAKARPEQEPEDPRAGVPSTIMFGGMLP